MNYFSRICQHFNQQSCVIQFEPRVIMPWERHDRHFLLRLGRVIMFPVTYHKQLDRINVAQRALNAYSREVLQMMALSYPLLKTFRVPVLLHEVNDLKTKDVEKLLMDIKY